MTTKTKWIAPEHAVGVDLGDRKSALCRLDAHGEVVERRSLFTTRLFFEAYFLAAAASIQKYAKLHVPLTAMLDAGAY